MAISKSIVVKDEADVEALARYQKRKGHNPNRMVIAYKYVRTTMTPLEYAPPMYSGLTYKWGKVAKVAKADTSNQGCAAGVNVATLKWVNQEIAGGNGSWTPGITRLVRIALGFKVSDIASIPTWTQRVDGKAKLRYCTKFRLHRALVLGEVDREGNLVMPTSF